MEQLTSKGKMPINSTMIKECLRGLARCLGSEVVRFDSRKFFEQQLLGSTPTLLSVLHGLACWCARNVGLPPTSSLCRLSRRSEFPLPLWLRLSPFAKGGWGVTYANKAREAQVLWQVLVTCLVIGEYEWALKHSIFINSTKQYTVCYEHRVDFVASFHPWFTAMDNFTKSSVSFLILQQ